MMKLMGLAFASVIALGPANAARASPPSTKGTAPVELPAEPTVPPHMRNGALVIAGVVLTVLGVGGAAGGLGFILSAQGQHGPPGTVRTIVGAPLLGILGPAALAGPIMIAVGASKTSKPDGSCLAPSLSVAVEVGPAGLVVRGTF